MSLYCITSYQIKEFVFFKAVSRHLETLYDIGDVLFLSNCEEFQGPVLLLRHDAVARILANWSAAFIESCAAICWNFCDSVKSL